MNARRPKLDGKVKALRKLGHLQQMWCLFDADLVFLHSLLCSDEIKTEALEDSLVVAQLTMSESCDG